MKKSMLLFISCLSIGMADSSVFKQAKKEYDAKNYVKAFDLYEKACAQKNIEGCFYVGWMYQKGLGTKQDYFKAVEYYQSTCNKNHGLACNNLGGMYDYGTGIKQDSSKALKYYTKACEDNVAIGCNNVGLLYSIGATSIDKDEEESIVNFSKACDLGMLKSCMDLASKYFDFNSNDVSAEDQEKAYIYYMKVCDKGTAADCYDIGFRYAGNHYFDGDKEKSSEFFKKSCEKGDKRGCEQLSWSDDKSISVKYSMKACEYGDTEECYRAGRIYYYGEGNVKQDIDKAKTLYKKHCDKVNYFGQCKNGIMQDYAQKLSTEEYVPKAVQFYSQKCNDKNAEACYSLGQMYYEGRGIERGNYQAENWKQAKYFYGKACDLKYTKGCENYGNLREY